MAMILAVPAAAHAQAEVPQQAETASQSTDAAQDSSSALGDIVVTAQKRSQKAQDVGIAITAISSDQLRVLNVTDLREIAGLTPGVHISGNLAGANVQYTIRGVTQSDFADISGSAERRLSR